MLCRDECFFVNDDGVSPWVIASVNDDGDLREERGEWKRKVDKHWHPSKDRFKDRVPSAVSQKRTNRSVTQCQHLRGPPSYDKTPPCPAIFKPKWNRAFESQGNRLCWENLYLSVQAETFSLSYGTGLKVPSLRHREVGAFLTHCGWNPALEGVAAGVVMLTWPIGAEQLLEATVIGSRARNGDPSWRGNSNYS
ncbi:hypothetical protein WN943_014153 [Citrus x changshan-huyou]